MIKLVIFDMAGTAVDENNIVYKTIFSALLNHGYQVDSSEVLEHCAGKEKWMAIKNVMDAKGYQTTDDIVDAVYETFTKRLNIAYEASDISLFTGMHNLLLELKDREISVVFNTGYSKAMAELILSKTGTKVGDDIDMLISSDDVDNGRPAPDMILKACTKLNIEPSQTLKVGDSIIDIKEGKAAAVALTVGVTTGAHNSSQLLSAEPDFVIDDIESLLDIVVQH